MADVVNVNRFSVLSNADSTEIDTEMAKHVKCGFCLDSTKCSNPTYGNWEGVLYFRGSWDSLSPFYADNIIFKGRHFHTSEHAYHHEKAIYHNDYRAAQEIHNAPLPGKAKSLAKRYFKKCSPDWNNIRFTVMEDIMFEKARQCKQFRDALIASGNQKLVHNMESDLIWGFGPDGLRQNKMGQILMRVRDHLIEDSVIERVPYVVGQRTYASIVKTKPCAEKLNKHSSQ